MHSDLPIALVGFMGSGKTTIGRLASRLMDIGFLDMDEELARAEGENIAEIFSLRGEAYFRQMEADLLQKLSCRNDILISCGGGIVSSPANLASLSRDFFTIALDVPLEELYKRLESGRETRPLLSSPAWKDSVDRLLLARQALYRRCSRFILRWNPGMSALDCATEIATRIREESGKARDQLQA